MAQKQFDRYQIIADLGEGGMATVYRAYDPRFRREVALKILPAAFLDDPAFHARFEREAQTIAALEHQAIVPVYDFGEADGQPYLVMRLMTGGSLADRLEGSPLSLPEITRIFSRLAPALDAAHRHGIIHRDLKPANILFDQYDEPYLADFGIAKWASQGDTTKALTGTGATVGTPAYMSPEQVQGQDLDGRSDVYALGVILFEMLTGKRPYEATTPMALAIKHVTDPVPVLRAQNLPPTCQMVINRAMAKNPEARYNNAAALTQELLAISSGIHLTPPPTSPTHLPSTAVGQPVSTSEVTEVLLPTPPPRPAIQVTPPPPTTPSEQKAVPTRGRKPSLPVLIGGGALGLLLCVVGFVALLFLLDILPPGATPTPLPEDIAAATPTPGPGTPNPTPAPTPGVTSPECLDEIGCIHIPAGEPIQIGVLQTLTDDLAPISGTDQVRGVELALAEQDRLLDHPLILQIEDELCSAEGGEAGANILLSNDQLVGVIGTTCDESASAAAPLFASAGWVMISGANTLPDLTRYQGVTGASHTNGFARTIFNNEWQAITAANFVYQELGNPRVAILREATVDSLRLSESFANTLTNLGGTEPVIIELGTDSAGQQAAIEALVSAQVDLVYLPLSYLGTVDMVTRIRTTDELNNLTLLASTTALSDSFLGSVGDYGLGLYAAAPQPFTRDRYTNYREQFLTTYQTNPADPLDYSVYAYDATQLLFRALEQVTQLRADGSLFIGRGALRQAVISSFAVEGASGLLTCDAFGLGDCGNAHMTIVQVQDPQLGLEAFRQNVVFQTDVNTITRPMMTLWYPEAPGTGGEEALLQVMEKVRAAFPNFDFHLEAIPFDELATRWREAVAQPGGPDILIHPAGFLTSPETAALDMTDWIGNRADNLEISARESLQIEGRQLGLPLSSDVVVLYVNSSLTITPPQTLDELLALVQGGQLLGWRQTAYHLFGLFPAYGAQLSEGTTACPNSEAALVGALRYLLSLQSAGATIALDISAAKEAFRNGEMPMLVDDSNMWLNYADALGDDLRIYPMPPATFAFQPLNSPDGVYLSPNTPDPNTAVDVALYMVGVEAQEIFMNVGGAVPTNLGVALPDELRQNLGVAAASAQPWPNRQVLAHDGTFLEGLLSAVLEEQRAPALAVPAACALYQNVLNNNQ